MRRIPFLLAVTVSAFTVMSGSAFASVARTVASPPVNTALPTINGTAREGQTLSATSGSWSGVTPIGYAYQWQQCNAAGSSCKSIGKATSQNYVVSRNDTANTIRVEVTATNADGKSQALSAATAAIAPLGSAPANTKQPNPAGTPQEGQTLTVDTGSWSGLQPITFSYQWQSCTAVNPVCTNIADKTGSSYLIDTGLIGSLLRATVTATNSAGTSSIFSNLTTAVTAKTAAPVATKLVAKFNAVLRAGQEVTRPKGVPATAAGHLTAKLTGRTLNWTLTFAHLSGRPTVTGLNKGVRGANGPAFKTLCTRCVSAARGTLTLTSSQRDALLRGRTYVNIHTTRNTYGEIRGQISRVS